MLCPVAFKENVADFWGVTLPTGPGISLIDDYTEMIIRYDDNQLEIKGYPDSHYPCNAYLYRTKKAPVVTIRGVKYFAYENAREI